MKCPLCGTGALVSEIRDLTYVYRDQTTTIRQAGDYCTHCGEGIFTQDQGDEYLATVNRFRAQVDSAPLTASEIRKIRKKLGLTQKAAGDLLGGGIRAFSQYERGETRPGKAVDTLLRLLERHPELLEELTFRNAA